jgi:hypothetical protein
MKNSNENGIGKSIRRSVSIFLIFAALAITNVAKAADLNGALSNNATTTTFPNPNPSDATSNASQLSAGAARTEGNHLSFTEPPAFYCVTDYGSFIMTGWALPGDSCYIQLNFFPYTTVWGIVVY